MHGSWLAIAVLMIMLAAGCSPQRDGSKERGNLTFLGTGGEEVARAQLEWPATLVQSGPFSGSWTLVSANDAFPARSGSRYEANRTESAIFINLTPNMADNNVELEGTISNGKFSGRWFHTTIAGPQPGGTFTLVIEP